MKKTVITLFLLLSMCGITSCGGSPEETIATDVTQETVEEPAVKEVDEIPEKEVTKYKASTYKVGTDIPAGEYVLFCDSFSGYFEVNKDSSGDFESIIANENFDRHTIVTVSDGQYFTMTGCYAVPIEECRSVDFTGTGMFKIGYHLPAGEYKIEVYEDSLMGYGYLEVSSDSTHSFDSIVTNDNFEGATYITVSDGEYLTLTECYIVNRPMTEAEILHTDKRTVMKVLFVDDFNAYLNGYETIDASDVDVWENLSSTHSTNEDILTAAEKDMDAYLAKEECLYPAYWEYSSQIYDFFFTDEGIVTAIEQGVEAEYYEIYYEFINGIGMLLQSQ